jgi:hypothetical protein
MSKKGGEKKAWDPEVEHLRKEPRPANLSEPLPPKKLPKELQDKLDNDETLWETLYEGRYVDSSDSRSRHEVPNVPQFIEEELGSESNVTFSHSGQKAEM